MSAARAPLAVGAVVVLVVTVIVALVPAMSRGPGAPAAASLSSANRVPAWVPPAPGYARSATRAQSGTEAHDGTTTREGTAGPTEQQDTPDGQESADRRNRPDTGSGDPDRTAPDPDAAPTPDLSRRSGGVTADLASYGAACDGTTNDQPALQQAANDMAGRGGGVVTVSGTCRIVQTASATFTTIAGPVTIRGVTDGATLRLDTDQPGAYRQLFRVSGDDVAFEDVTLARAADIYGIMIGLNGPADLSLDNVLLDGHKNRYPGTTFHGIAIFGDSGDVRNARMTRTTIRNTDFALFQPSNVTTATDGFTVDRSTFTGNHADDLEFNSPNARMTNITVTNSRFSDNRAADERHIAGFGVGLANVQNALIQGNTFDGYRFEPVHIEDRSADVTVHDNAFTDSFTAPLNFASHVFVVAGSHHITITGNTFDTSANDNRIDCVYLGSGGGAAIDSVRVRDNTFLLRPNASAIGQYGVTNVEESGNTATPLP